MICAASLLSGADQRPRDLGIMGRLVEGEILRLGVQHRRRELRLEQRAAAEARIRPAVIGADHVGQGVVDRDVVHRLGELRRRQDDGDHDPSRMAARRPAQGGQPVVARGRSPPARPRVQVDGRRCPAHRVERAGVPARPEADALADLVGEDKVEVLGAQGRPRDPLDLLQHPRADIGVGGRPGRDRRPGPGELDVRQMDVEPDQVQRPGQRHEHRERDRLAEHQAHQRQDRGPLDPARDQTPSRARASIWAAGPQAVRLAARPRRGQRLTSDDPGVVRGVAGTLEPGTRFLPVVLVPSAERAGLQLSRPRGQHAQQQNQEAKHEARLFCAAAWVLTRPPDS